MIIIIIFFFTNKYKISVGYTFVWMYDALLPWNVILKILKMTYVQATKARWFDQVREEVKIKIKIN